MKRAMHLIVRIDYATVPADVTYVAHGDTPYDLNLRWTPYRESATLYSNKKQAIQEAKRISKIYRQRIKVVDSVMYHCEWTNAGYTF
jgi:hypothetical protein